MFLPRIPRLARIPKGDAGENSNGSSDSVKVFFDSSALVPLVTGQLSNHPAALAAFVSHTGGKNAASASAHTLAEERASAAAHAPARST